jgi:hypothetical protein
VSKKKYVVLIFLFSHDSNQMAIHAIKTKYLKISSNLCINVGYCFVLGFLKSEDGSDQKERSLALMRLFY